MEKIYGVYIGEDCEAVITQHVTLAFLKDTATDTLTAYLLRTDSLSCLGVCRIRPIPAQDCGFQDFRYYCAPPQSVCYAMQQGKDILSNDPALREMVSKQILTADFSRAAPIFYFAGSNVREEIPQEIFPTGAPVPDLADASAGNLARCLQGWHLGVHAEDCGVTINTPGHMYIFHVEPTFVYCRAARYAVCEKGVVFNQNFRINLHGDPLQGEASLYGDNRIAAQELSYHADFLSPDRCVFNDVNIYWSVASFSPNRIVLHGCGGDTYYWDKPSPCA